MGNAAINIIIIDKDEEVINLLKTTLETEGYAVTVFNDSQEGLKAIIETNPHLVLIELKMQGLDGIELCTELRTIEKINNTRIVLYSEINEDNAQVAAFNAGADGYMVKPIKPRVLISRVRAYLRRFSGQTEGGEKIKYKGLRIDRERYLIFKDDNEIILPKKEFELLSLLSSIPKKVFTRKEIAKQVWGYEVITNRTIDVHVRMLRMKLGEGYIKTIKGVGYSLEV